MQYFYYTTQMLVRNQRLSYSGPTGFNQIITYKNRTCVKYEPYHKTQMGGSERRNS